MKRGFTLIELLVVMGIMGLLGTVSVGGYRQMRRGMEEKGVIQDVDFFVRAAYQRAQIDRQPTAVVFWNETLRSSDDVDESAIVVGRAVAVRRSGRITKVSGDILLDEFGDLELSHQTEDDESSGGSSKADMYLYPMDDLREVESSSDIRRSLVETKVYKKEEMPVYLTGNGVKTEQMSSGTSGESSGRLTIYGFKLRDQNGINWKVGKAYGFEFAHIELPHGYIFGGSSYAPSSGNPVKPAGSLVFDVGYNSGNGMTAGTSGGLGSRTTIDIYALRPDTSGNLAAKKIGATSKPTDKMK